MHIRTCIPAATALLLLFSCNNDQRERVAASQAPASSGADMEAVVRTAGMDDPARKMMREADFRCRVGDVLRATRALENSVQAAGGLVAQSRVENSILETRTLDYSDDSLQQVQRFLPTATLQLRIPSGAVDSVLDLLIADAQFTDLRDLRLVDATLPYIENNMRAAAGAVPASAKPGDSGAAERQDAQSDVVINSRIDNLRIEDRVRFATVTVGLYGPESLDVMLVANSGNALNPSFGKRVGMALYAGVDLLKSAAVALLYIWPLLLAGIAVALFLRRRRIKFVARPGLRS